MVSLITLAESHWGLAGMILFFAHWLLTSAASL
jgi:hypothetical protein